MKILILNLGLLIFLLSCSGGKKLSTQMNPIDGEDCHPNRRTIQVFEEKKGLIALVGPNFIITNLEGSQRYQACALPEEFHEEGLEIIFSGTQVEILPGERRYAKPLRLKAIDRLESKK